jgi:hypothetical protein
MVVGANMKIMATLMIFFLAVPLSGWAAQITCPDSEITVVAEKRAECDSVCEAVQIGDDFLKSIGLKLSGRLVITLYQELPSNSAHNFIGFYDSRCNEIALLGYNAALSASHQSPPSFGVLMSPVIWRSFVIHELAHAAAQKRFASGVPVRTATEYIATVAQIATLPYAEREEIIQNYSGLSGFDNPREITSLYYMLDPSKFSVNAYLHYSKPENGSQFIKQILREGLTDN